MFFFFFVHSVLKCKHHSYSESSGMGQMIALRLFQAILSRDLATSTRLLPQRMRLDRPGLVLCLFLAPGRRICILARLPGGKAVDREQR
jgi:hypothetical protein